MKTNSLLTQPGRTWRLAVTAFLLMMVGAFVSSETALAQGINYPVGNPTGTSGTGNARTDPDNFFMRNNIAGMTEIAVNDTEEKTGTLGDSGKGAFRFFGEIQESFYKYQRSRPFAPQPGLGVTSETSLFAPGAAAEITYTSGNHRYAVGVGTYQVFGFQSKIADPSTLGARTTFFDTRIASNDFAFGGAVRLNSHLSLGGSFVFGRGFLDLKAPVPQLAALGIIRDSRLDVSDVGAPGYTLGAHLRFNDKVSFGFNYKHRRKYEFTGELDTIAAKVGPGGLQLFPAKLNASTTFELPRIAELGFQFKPWSKVTILADYRYYQYSETLKNFIVKDQSSGQPLATLTINGKDVHSARVGMIYTHSDITKFNFGVAFTSSGIPDKTLNPGLINTGGVDLSGAIHRKVFGQWVNFGVAGIFGHQRSVLFPINPASAGVYEGKGILVGLGIRLRR